MCLSIPHLRLKSSWQEPGLGVFPSSKCILSCLPPCWSSVNIKLLFFFFLNKLQALSFPGGSDSKESAYNVNLIPRSARSPGEGNGYPLQYSCLENSMDRGACWTIVHGIAKSRTQLSDFTMTNSFTFHWGLESLLRPPSQ